MNQYKSIITLLSTIFLGTINSLNAEVFFEMDFENFDTSNMTSGKPVWSLPAGFNDLYGPSNHFIVTDVSSHSGRFSMRFDYAGRNGFCNTCGSNIVTQKQGLDNVNYLVANGGENLADDQHRARTDRVVFNRGGGFSKWEIISVDNENSNNDKLNLKLIREGMNGENTINGGDNIAITRQCGVDGKAAKQNGKFLVNRRIDCDAVIAWFENVAPQSFGQSIFRRIYIKSEISSPVIHQKLRYWRLPEIKDYFGAGVNLNKDNIILLADAINGPLKPNISGLGTYGGLFHKPGNGNGMPKDTVFERSTWYYIEEEFKAESSPGAGDGAYRLWLSKSGEEVSAAKTPLIEHTNLTLPPIKGGPGEHASFWGNIQHSSHTVGVWYIDDIKIADTRIGYADVAADGNNVRPPKSPNTP